jgi:hypothetical protein
MALKTISNRIEPNGQEAAERMNSSAVLDAILRQVEAARERLDQDYDYGKHLISLGSQCVSSVNKLGFWRSACNRCWVRAQLSSIRSVSGENCRVTFVVCSEGVELWALFESLLRMITRSRGKAFVPC